MSNKFIKPEYLEKISRLRLIDDIFMRKVFENNIPATELLLRIIMDNDKIKVIKAQSQADARFFLHQRRRYALQTITGTSKIF